jgi:hypothetical protein
MKVSSRRWLQKSRSIEALSSDVERMPPAGASPAARHRKDAMLLRSSYLPIAFALTLRAGDGEDMSGLLVAGCRRSTGGALMLFLLMD